MSQSNGGVATTSRLTLFPMQNYQTGVVAFYAFDPATGFDDKQATSSHFFKVEEVIAGRTPTISKLIVVYRDLGKATVTFTLTGTNEEGQVVGGAPPAQATISIGNTNPTGKLMMKLVDISLTAQNIQLNVFRAAGGGPVSLAKIVMCGRVEVGQEFA